MGRRYKRGFTSCHWCDKELYRSRKEARRVARVSHPEKVLNAYYCPLGKGWHYGNLPEGGREVARVRQKDKIKRVRRMQHGSPFAAVGSVDEGLASGQGSGTDLREEANDGSDPERTPIEQSPFEGSAEASE